MTIHCCLIIVEKKFDIGYVLQQYCSFLSCGSFYKLNTLSLIYLEINVST